jgi:hypothetical protein
MAVYIRSSNLGSRREPEPKRFKAERSYYNTHIQKRREELNSEYESNAEVQAWRTMTPEEKRRNAIDRQTKLLKDHNDMTSGTDTTADKANRKAIEISERAEKIKSGS